MNLSATFSLRHALRARIRLDQSKRIAVFFPALDTIIPSFILTYNQEKYTSLARETANICHQVLSRKGIAHQTESRGKAPESLRKKLEKRKERRGRFYRTHEEIKEDIVDLAGARIILDKWKDRESVKAVIYDTFDVHEEIFKQVKHGYHAVHFRVYLKANKFFDSKRYSERSRQLIEIQVQSLLMAQWAKLEHSIRYKGEENPSKEINHRLDSSFHLVEIYEAISEKVNDDQILESAKRVLGDQQHS